MNRLLVPLACLLLLAGCREGTPAPSPTPTVTSASPTPSPSPTPTPTPSPTPTAFVSFPAELPTEDPVSAAILAGWQEYWRVYGLFAADPLGDRDLTETQYVTTGGESTGLLDKIAGMREDRIRSDGGFVFRDVVVEPGPEDASPRTATVSYCIDRSNLRIFEIDTGKQIPADGTLKERTELELMPDGVWVVSRIRNEKASC